MQEFVQWVSEYWIFIPVFVLVCVAAFFVFRAASKSYKRYYKNYHAQEVEIKRLIALKDKYGTLCAAVIDEADEDELLEGTALSYQLVLQKAEDMSAEFAKLEKEKQYIYALDVFVQDGSLKTFFRENGRELTEIIVPAIQMIGLDEIADKTEKIRLMFDEKDETTSVSEEIIDETEKYFENADVLTMIKHSAAKYIKKNKEQFI